MIVGKHTESRAAIVLRSKIQACIRRRFDGIAVDGKFKQYNGANVDGQSSYPCPSRELKQKLLHRDKSRQGLGIAHLILLSASAARHKRTRRKCAFSVEGTGIHEDKVPLTLVDNRRTRLVLVAYGKNSYARKDKESSVPCCNRAPRLDTRLHGGVLTAPSSVQGYMKP